MRIFIAADIEGCTGVVHYDQLSEGQPRYQAARRLMTGDINAAIEGVLEVVPDATFTVGDGHADMRNVVLEELNAAAELVIGSSNPDNKPLCQCEGMDQDHDLAFLVGFHSRAGTSPGLLAHTLVGSQINRFMLNGTVVGEAAIAESICAAYGAPIALVVGNDELLPECENTLQPGFEFVATKRTLGRTAAICRTPAATGPAISKAARSAVENFMAGNLAAPSDTSPTEMTVEFFKADTAARAGAIAGISRVDERTILASANNGAECFRLVWKSICNGLMETPSWLT